MKGMPRQTARCAIVETGYIPSHQRNATPNEVVRTETGFIPSLHLTGRRAQDPPLRLRGNSWCDDQPYRSKKFGLM
ncbi:MAG: hypothetical protein IKR05_09975 [Prevotella sp.]|nr:hypothetical protein [Prevotella sp.]